MRSHDVRRLVVDIFFSIFILKLHCDIAPRTCENFIRHCNSVSPHMLVVECVLGERAWVHPSFSSPFFVSCLPQGYYKNTVFHRSIKHFMVQVREEVLFHCGGPQSAEIDAKMHSYPRPGLYRFRFRAAIPPERARVASPHFRAESPLLTSSSRSCRIKVRRLKKLAFQPASFLVGETSNFSQTLPPCPIFFVCRSRHLEYGKLGPEHK